jgi:hypothetical protein
MNARKEAKLNMYHSVIALCEGNLPIIALVLAFQTSYNAFKITVTAIVTAAAQLQMQTGGLAISKKTAKKNLAELASGIAGLVYAYASVIYDDDLKAAMHITSSDISQALDEEVPLICGNVYTAANTHLVALADYGVTGLLLMAFQAAIDDYVDKAPKPILNRSQKKALRAQMYLMFGDADVILKEQLDKIAINFLRNGNALFYGKYHASREIMDPGSYSTVLKLFVLNSATNEPLHNVKCFRDDSPLFKKSSKKGFVTYKNIAEGNHRFKLKHKLFADAAASASISHGYKTTANVVMQAV